jgi:cobalt-zinc-cadmium efflux system protein
VQGRAFLLAIVLNTAFVAIEFGYGLAARSMALLADAGHNLSDVLALVLAWAALQMGRRAPGGRYTYGLRASSILAALANAMLLLLACGAMALEAVQRFTAPPAVGGVTVMVVAGIGIVVNGFSAWLFMRGSQHDLNVRGAYLHMAADALVSLGVVLAGFAMVYTGWYWLDPVASLVIVAVIVAGTWGLLRESVRLALNAVPAGVDVAAVESRLKALPGVREIHDLHIWGLSTTEVALTVHLVMPGGYPGDAFLDEVVAILHREHGIHHCTLQVEEGTTWHACALHGRGHGHGHGHDHDHDHDHDHGHVPGHDPVHGHGERVR